MFNYNHIKYLRCSAVLFIFLIICSNTIDAQEFLSTSEVPAVYFECMQINEKDNSVDVLSCDFSASTDKTNNEETQKFLKCRAMYPGFSELLDAECKYIENKGNTAVPRILQCKKSDGTFFWPGIWDRVPCNLRFYNPDYEFPRDFQECKDQGNKMLNTYTGGEICHVDIELCDKYSSYCTFVVNHQETEILIKNCRELGGHFEKRLGEIPSCDLSFTAEIEIQNTIEKSN